MAETVMGVSVPQNGRHARGENYAPNFRIQTLSRLDRQKLNRQADEETEEEEKKEEDDEGLLQTKRNASDNSLLQRQTDETEEEEEKKKKKEDEEEQTLLTKRSSAKNLKVSPKLEERLKSNLGGDHPLPELTRAFFENRFGHDFSQIKVHDDAHAAETARELNAQAFTRGNDIFFDAGQYQPNTPQGRWLLAHELTHVVQQQPESPLVAKTPFNFEYKLNRPGESPQSETGQTAGRQTQDQPVLPRVKWWPFPQANNLIARRMSDQSSSAFRTKILISAPRLAALVKWILEQLQEAPEDRSTRISRRLAQLDSATREEVLAQVRDRIAPEQKEHLDEILFESDFAADQFPAPPTALATPPVPAPAVGATQSPDIIKVPATEAVEAVPEAAALAAEGGPEAKPEAEPVEEVPTEATEAVPAEGAEVERSPASPEEDPAFQAVIERTNLAAMKEKKHAPAKAKASEAQAAAVSPPNEVSSRAADQQVQEMDQQQPKPFDRAGFKAAVLERIAAIAPKTLEQADEFKESGRLDTVKGHLTTQVAKDKAQAQGALSEKVAEKPDTTGIEPKPVKPLPPAAAGPPPPDLAAAQAAPKPKTASEVSLQEGSKALDQQMADAEITEEQLQKSNEPSFQAAVEAKKTAQTDAAEAPQAYRKDEEATLAGAQTEAQTAAKINLEGMHGERAQQLTQVLEQQNVGKSSDQQKRSEIATQIEGIYARTKEKVEQRLERLDTEVNQRFDQGAAAAQRSFEDYVEQRMEAYKKERYDGVTGWALWLKDKVLGLPDEVNAFYEEGRQLYLNEMDKVIDDIATLVETGLTEAKNEIATGKQEIRDYVKSLPLALQKFGEEAAQNIQSKFDELEQSVDEKKNQLIESLAQKYTENLKALNAHVDEMKAANRGLVDAARDAIKGVIATIIELKNALVSVLAKAAEAVSLIIRDPIGFLGNLVTGVKQGLQNFMSKIGEHLQQGLMGWLLGAFAEAGIQLPEKFDLKGIFSLVMQILQLTYAAFRRRAVQLVGEEVVSKLEQFAEIFKIFITEGPIGIWEFIKEKVGDIKSQIFDTIKSFVQEKIIIAGITWVLSLLNPASAFVKAVKLIIDIVKFFIERGKQILALVNAVIDSVSAIAKGALDAAAKLVEDALAKSVPVLISFLAALLGLSGISEKIKTIIEKIRAPISKAIDWVVAQAVKLIKKAGKLLGFGKKEEKAPETADPQHDAKVEAGLSAINRDEQRYLKNGRISKENAEKVANEVKRDHPIFKSIKVVAGETTWDYIYSASNGKKTIGEERIEGDDEITTAYKEGKISKQEFVKQVTDKALEKLIDPDVTSAGLPIQIKRELGVAFADALADSIRGTIGDNRFKVQEEVTLRTTAAFTKRRLPRRATLQLPSGKARGRRFDIIIIDTLTNETVGTIEAKLTEDAIHPLQQKVEVEILGTGTGVVIIEGKQTPIPQLVGRFIVTKSGVIKTDV